MCRRHLYPVYCFLSYRAEVHTYEGLDRVQLFSSHNIPLYRAEVQTYEGLDRVQLFFLKQHTSVPYWSSNLWSIGRSSTFSSHNIPLYRAEVQTCRSTPKHRPDLGQVSQLCGPNTRHKLKALTISHTNRAKLQSRCAFVWKTKTWGGKSALYSRNGARQRVRIWLCESHKRRKHAKLNNEKIRWVTYPGCFSTYLYMGDLHFIKKENKFIGYFFSRILV